MKYTAIKVAKNLRNEYEIQGQRNTDYNWETLNGCSGTFDFLVNANNCALDIAKSLSAVQKNYIPVYGLGGYGIGSYYKGKKYEH